MDSFQTRDDDDLFGDEITPVQPTQTAAPSNLVPAAYTSETSPTPDDLSSQINHLDLSHDDRATTPRGPRHTRGHGQNRARPQTHIDRRRDRDVDKRRQASRVHGTGAASTSDGSHGNTGSEVTSQGTPASDLSKSKWAHTPLIDAPAKTIKTQLSPILPSAAVPSTAPASEPASTIPAEPVYPSPSQNQIQQESKPVETPPAPASHPTDTASPSTTVPAASASSSRPTPVRGDRTTTGGLPKPRLTPSELDAKLASARLRSQAVAEAHARAEADARDFAAREEVAAVQRKQESERRRLLEGEREKNRVRKLRSLAGREWDVGKEEREEEVLERGSRGRGRGRGRGKAQELRGGYRNGDNKGTDTRGNHGLVQRKPNVYAVEQFPALPGADTAGLSRSDPATTGTRVTGSWADQVNDVQMPESGGGA